MDAVIYTRKSSAAEGTSTRDQEKENRQWCAREGHPVIQVFCDEGISASRHGTKTRNAWTDLKAYLQPGHILVVWASSRHSRDMEEFVLLRSLCRQLGVPLAYGGHVYDLNEKDDSFVATLHALLSEREADEIKNNILRGKRASAADGKPYGKAPWGYRAIKPAVWEPDPIEAARIRQAVGRILDGETQASVLRWLKSTGHAPANITSLRIALANPALIGKRIHQGEIVGDATWEPIITEAERHQLLARVKMTRNWGGPEPKHLLSGIALCGKCEQGVHYRHEKNKQPTYVCRHGHVGRNADALDKEAEEKLFKRLRSINPEDYDSANRRVAEALRQIEAIEADLDQWIEAASKGEVTAAAFSKIEKGRRQTIAELRPKTLAGTKMLYPENWVDLTLREKRDAIRAHLKIVIIPVQAGGGVQITPA